MAAIANLGTSVFGSGAAGPNQSIPAWRNDKRLLGLVSCNEKNIELACLGAHKKHAEWLEGGQEPVAGLNGAWDLLLEDRVCQGIQFGPLWSTLRHRVLSFFLKKSMDAPIGNINLA